MRFGSDTTHTLLLRQEVCTRGDAKESSPGPFLPPAGRSVPATMGRPDGVAGYCEALLIGHSCREGSSGVSFFLLCEVSGTSGEILSEPVETRGLGSLLICGSISWLADSARGLVTGCGGEEEVGVG